MRYKSHGIIQRHFGLCQIPMCQRPPANHTRNLHIKSTSTAHKYVNILVSEGKIQKDDKLTRQLKIPGMTSIIIPYFKKVYPKTNFNNPDRYIPFYPLKNQKEKLFAIPLNSEELNQKQLHRNDIVILKKADSKTNTSVFLKQIHAEVEIIGMIRLYQEAL